MSHRRRPSRHIRRVHTKYGTKRRMINPHIPPRKRVAMNISKHYPELSTSKAGQVVGSTFDGISDILKRDHEYTQPGFGKFVVKHRKARKGRNPFTGKPIQIKAKKTIKFRPAKQLKKDVL